MFEREVEPVRFGALTQEETLRVLSVPGSQVFFQFREQQILVDGEDVGEDIGGILDRTDRLASCGEFILQRRFDTVFAHRAHGVELPQTDRHDRQDRRHPVENGGGRSGQFRQRKPFLARFRAQALRCRHALLNAGKHTHHQVLRLRLAIRIAGFQHQLVGFPDDAIEFGASPAKPIWKDMEGPEQIDRGVLVRELPDGRARLVILRDGRGRLLVPR